jgi:hypothetical protein
MEYLKQYEESKDCLVLQSAVAGMMTEIDVMDVFYTLALHGKRVARVTMHPNRALALGTFAWGLFRDGSMYLDKEAPQDRVYFQGGYGPDGTLRPLAVLQA